MTMYVYVHVRAPASSYGELSKGNFRKAGHRFDAVLWETADFVCPKHGVVIDGNRVRIEQ